jgi:hypothetical protein
MPIPTVPLPGEQTEALRAPMDNQRISPDQYGAQVGEGLLHLAAGVEKVRAEADALAAQEAETAYSREILGTVHGAPDESGEFKPGFSSLRGHKALEASTPTLRNLEQRRAQIASSLKNERQRRIFLGRTQAEVLGAQRTVEAHAAEQVAFLQREGLTTRLDVAAQTAAASVLTPGGQADVIGASRQIDAMRAWLEVGAEQQGLRGEDAQRFVRAGQGAVASAVLERLLEDPKNGGRGYASEARSFLEANRPLLNEKEAAKYATRLGGAEIRDKSLAKADEIWAAAKGEPSAAVEAVRAIGDGALRDAVDQRVKARIAEDHAVRVASDSPREGRIEQAIYQGRGLDRNADDYLALSDEGKARVEAKFHASQRSQRAEGSEDRRRQREMDAEAVAHFNALPLKAEDGGDQVSIDVDRSDAYANASPTARFKIKAAQKRARGDWDKDQGVSRDEFRAKVDQVAAGLGYDGKGQAARRKAFVDYMVGERQNWLDAHPQAKAIPPEAASKMFEEALKYGDKGGLHTSGNRYAYQSRLSGETFSAEGFDEQPGVELLKRLGIVKGGEAPQPTQPAPAPRPAPMARTQPTVRVKSKAEALALPKGTRFLDPNGVERVR